MEYADAQNQILQIAVCKACTCGCKEHDMPFLQKEYFREDSFDAIRAIQSTFLPWMQLLLQVRKA